MNRFLIAGLGNPGEEYADTRHNVGFTIADAVASGAGVKFVTGRQADVAAFKYKGRAVTLIKPTTFMNLSGKAVNYWLQAEKIPVENLLVLVDEIALPFGKIRIGPKGSDGGHNGLASVHEALGSTNYPRLRFGIGSEFSKGGQVNYVLGKWSAEEQTGLRERVSIAAEAVRSFVFEGLERCMSTYNTR